jgi:hypothetical protein
VAGRSDDIRLSELSPWQRVMWTGHRDDLTPDQMRRLAALGFVGAFRDNMFPLETGEALQILAVADRREAAAEAAAKAEAREAVRRYREDRVAVVERLRALEAEVAAFPKLTVRDPGGVVEARHAARRRVCDLQRSLDAIDHAIATNDAVAKGRYPNEA